MTREYRETRRAFWPEEGKEYENEGGGFYRCTWALRDKAGMISRAGWYLTAHGIGIYEDGRIDWDYSTGGRFLK